MLKLALFVVLASLATQAEASTYIHPTSIPGILTENGNVPTGSQCKFPFMYNGQEYSECIMSGWYRPWCSTTDDFNQDNKWGECVENNCLRTELGNAGGACCKFPYTYQGKTYDRCIDTFYPEFWCPVSADYATDGRWGECKLGNCLKTEGGNSNGAVCKFPFTYRGKKYNKCIRNSITKSWCGTTEDFDKDKKWGNCIPVDLEPCACTPCQNEGVCFSTGVAGVNGVYTCSCVNGWYGKNCDIRDGGWSEWDPSNACSATCGGGTREVTRKCDNPAASGGGNECEGEDKDTQTCNTDECPQECPMMDYAIPGGDIQRITTATWEECGKACFKNEDCYYWTWGVNTKCYLKDKNSIAGKVKADGKISGDSSCGDPGCYWTKQKDGTGDGETQIGTFKRDRDCVKACEKAAKTNTAIKGATVGRSDRKCYCELGMKSIRQADAYNTCFFRTAGEGTGQTEHTCDWQTGDGQGGDEFMVGQFENRSECIATCEDLAKHDKTIKGVTMPKNGNACYCEQNMGTVNSASASYQTCYLQ